MSGSDPSRTRGSRPLAVEADLLLTTPTGPVAVQGDGSRLVARFAGLSHIWRLASAGPGRTLRRRMVRHLDAGLRRGQLQLSIHLNAARDRPLARLGHGARPGLLTRLLGLPGVELSWSSLFDALRPSSRSSSRYP